MRAGVAKLPPEKQVAAVVDELKKRNPHFDGSGVTSRIEKDAIVHLWIVAEKLTDLSPVRALKDLSFDTIAGAAKQAAKKGPPPVHLWNPPFCGDLDMRIGSDGTWHYLKTPIGRPALVRLFASEGRHGEARRRYRIYGRRMEEIDVEAAPYPATRQR